MSEAGSGLTGVGGLLLPNTCDSAGLDFSLDCVGIVNLRAAGLEDGVDGRVGGTLKSLMRPVELLCDLALEAAVAPSYLAVRCSGGGKGGGGGGFELDAWPVSIRDDKEALRVNFLLDAGLGGFKPECDF